MTNNNQKARAAEEYIIKAYGGLTEDDCAFTLKDAKENAADDYLAGYEQGQKDLVEAAIKSAEDHPRDIRTGSTTYTAYHSEVIDLEELKRLAGIELTTEPDLNHKIDYQTKDEE